MNRKAIKSCTSIIYVLVCKKMRSLWISIPLKMLLWQSLRRVYHKLNLEFISDWEHTANWTKEIPFAVSVKWIFHWKLSRASVGIWECDGWKLGNNVCYNIHCCFLLEQENYLLRHNTFQFILQIAVVFNCWAWKSSNLSDALAKTYLDRYELILQTLHDRWHGNGTSCSRLKGNKPTCACKWKNSIQSDDAKNETK